MLSVLCAAAHAFSPPGHVVSSPPAGEPTRSIVMRNQEYTSIPKINFGSRSHWMDVLKFGGREPTFSVLERTQDYAACATQEEAAEYYADDYVFRGSVIGPITNKDVRETQEGFNIQDAYPDLDRGVFGFTVDPKNPFRCFFFERWTGTNNGDPVSILGRSFGPTGDRVETPLHITSVTWNPNGKIVYQCISPPLDRFEGNTEGQGAVFGLLKGAGFDISRVTGPASPGNPVLARLQKLNQLLGQGKAFSADADLPPWWKSKARGADSNDM